MRLIASIVGLGVVAGGAAAFPVTTFLGEDLTTNVPFGTLTNTRAAQADFLSNLDGVSTESFETQALGSSGPFNLSFQGSAGTIGATASGSGISIQDDVFGIGQIYATDGDQYLFASTDTSGGLSLTFDTPVAAFGFTATDLSDRGATVVLNLSNGTSTIVPLGNTVGSGASTDGSALFFGVIALGGNTFTSVEFQITGGDSFDSFGFDELTVGDFDQVSLVPLPTGAGLAALGLAIVGVRRRR